MLNRSVLLLALTPITAVAQTLDHASNAPVIGAQYTMHVGPYVPPEAAGSAVAFDLSGMVATGSRTYNWMSPSVYSNPSVFPNATACLVGGVNNDTLFYSVTSTGVELVGEKKNYLSLASVVAPYSDGPRELQFPLAYQDTWTDGISSIFNIPDVGTANRSGNIVGVADALGTIQLPGMTAGVPALRVHTRVQESIVAGIYNITHRRQVHDYYVQWSRWPVMRTVADSLTTPFGINQYTTYTEWVDATQLGVEAVADPFNVELAPNPVNDRLSLGLDALGGRVRWEVTGLNGAVLLNGDLGVLSAGRERRSIDVQQLVAGTYQIRLFDATGRRTVKRFVVVR